MPKLLLTSNKFEMVGKIEVFNQETNESSIEDFYFLKSDLRTMYKVEEGIKIYLYGQGWFILEPDELLFEQLKSYFNG